MSSCTSIYLIEDNERLADLVERAIDQRPDMKLLGRSSSLQHALQHACATKADLYLVDLGLPDGDGCDLIRVLAQECPGSERLVFTVFGDESRLILALEAGATGYVLKGSGIEELMDAIEHARQGGAPVSPILARLLLKHFHKPVQPQAHEEPAYEDEAALTAKETQVLRLIAMGYINREIADEMGLSGHTVTTHTKNIYKKLGVHTRVQATNAAKERRIV